MQATEAELGWFAGMLEGEGCISFFRQIRKKHDQLHLMVQITNTDINIIDKLIEILNKCEISWYVREKKVYSKKHSQCWFIECRQQEMLRKTLETFIPYMHGAKKAKAKLLLSFLNKRFEKYQKTGKYNTRYSEEELSLIPRDSTFNTQIG